MDKWRCVWCGKDRVKPAEYVQKTTVGSWEDICGTCYGKRWRLIQKNTFALAFLDIRNKKRLDQ